MLGKDILVGIIGCVFLAKEIGKGIKRQKCILSHLFMKIKEIRRKIR